MKRSNWLGLCAFLSWMIAGTGWAGIDSVRLPQVKGRFENQTALSNADLTLVLTYRKIDDSPGGSSPGAVLAREELKLDPSGVYVAPAHAFQVRTAQVNLSVWARGQRLPLLGLEDGLLFGSSLFLYGSPGGGNSKPYRSYLAHLQLQDWSATRLRLRAPGGITLGDYVKQVLSAHGDEVLESGDHTWSIEVSASVASTRRPHPGAGGDERSQMAYTSLHGFSGLSGCGEFFDGPDACIAGSRVPESLNRREAVLALGQDDLQNFGYVLVPDAYFDPAPYQLDAGIELTVVSKGSPKFVAVYDLLWEKPQDWDSWHRLILSPESAEVIAFHDIQLLDPSRTRREK
jgi:hypothetical protein